MKGLSLIVKIYIDDNMGSSPNIWLTDACQLVLILLNSHSSARIRLDGVIQYL